MLLHKMGAGVTEMGQLLHACCVVKLFLRCTTTLLSIAKKHDMGFNGLQSELSNLRQRDVMGKSVV